MLMGMYKGLLPICAMDNAGQCSHARKCKTQVSKFPSLTVLGKRLLRCWTGYLKKRQKRQTDNTIVNARNVDFPLPYEVNAVYTPCIRLFISCLMKIVRREFTGEVIH